MRGSVPGVLGTVAAARILVVWQHSHTCRKMSRPGWDSGGDRNSHSDSPSPKSDSRERVYSSHSLGPAVAGPFLSGTTRGCAAFAGWVREPIRPVPEPHPEWRETKPLICIHLDGAFNSSRWALLMR